MSELRPRTPCGPGTWRSGQPALARDVDDKPGEVVDRHDLFGAEIEWFAVLGAHESVDPLDAIVDVAERPGLHAVAPDLDLRHLWAAATFRQIAAGDLLAATVGRPDGP